MLDDLAPVSGGETWQLSIVGRAFTQTLAGSIIAYVFFKVWPFPKYYLQRDRKPPVAAVALAPVIA